MSQFSAVSDRLRLCRIFGLEPVKPWGALTSAAVLAIIPWGTWIIGGPIALGIAGLIADENRRIAAGLREVEAWGFPVEGYRAWLLAVTPVFDIELRREVSIDLLIGSFAAVDPTIGVERRGARIARVTMQKIEIEGTDNAPILQAGDRKRLHEVHARVLASLHADAGIVAMRMGDRDTLTALVASPRTETADVAFREPAAAAPSELQALVQAGTSHQRPPQEALALRTRTDRLLYATGQIPTTARALAGAFSAITVVGGIVGAATALGTPLGFLFGAAFGAFTTFVMRSGDRARVQRALARAQKQGFAIEGYDVWLLSGRPMFDIELERAVPASEVESLLLANDRRLTVHWITDRIVRVESPPVMHMASQGIRSFWGGDPNVLSILLDEVFVPLHRAHGVVAVRMGGYLDRRA